MPTPMSATKPRSRPSITRATLPARTLPAFGQSSAASAAKPCSASRWPMRSREPRVQAATAMRRPSAVQRSAWARNWSNTLAPGPRARLGEYRPRTAAAIHAGRPLRPGKRPEAEHRAERKASPPSRHGRDRAGPAAADDTAPRPRAAAPAGVVVVGDHLQPGGQHILGLMVQAEGGAGEIIQQRFHALVEQRHPVLHAGMAPPLGDREIDRVRGRALAEHLAPAGAEAGDRGLVEEHLRHRPQRPAASAARRCAGWPGRRRGCSRWCRRTGPAAPGRAGRPGTYRRCRRAPHTRRAPSPCRRGRSHWLRETAPGARDRPRRRPPATGWRHGTHAAAAHAAPGHSPWSARCAGRQAFPTARRAWRCAR